MGGDFRGGQGVPLGNFSSKGQYKCLQEPEKIPYYGGWTFDLSLEVQRAFVFECPSRGRCSQWVVAISIVVGARWQGSPAGVKRRSRKVPGRLKRRIANFSAEKQVSEGDLVEIVEIPKHEDPTASQDPSKDAPEQPS
jgi:hypothetical protein